MNRNEAQCILNALRDFEGGDAWEAKEGLIDLVWDIIDYIDLPDIDVVSGRHILDRCEDALRGWDYCVQDKHRYGITIERPDGSP